MYEDRHHFGSCAAKVSAKLEVNTASVVSSVLRVDSSVSAVVQIFLSLLD